MRVRSPTLKITGKKGDISRITSNCGMETSMENIKSKIQETQKSLEDIMHLLNSYEITNPTGIAVIAPVSP